MSGAKACKSCTSRQELSNEYLLAKFGVDTAENEPLKVLLILQPWDLIFTEPPRPSIRSAESRKEGANRGSAPGTSRIARRTTSRREEPGRSLPARTDYDEHLAEFHAHVRTMVLQTLAFALL